METNKFKSLRLQIISVAKANFNDTYYIETKYINLNDILSDELVWIDPYNGRSRINNTLIAINSINDGEIIFLEKKDGKVVEKKNEINSEYICCEEFDKNFLLASHIDLSMNNN